MCKTERCGKTRWYTPRITQAPGRPVFCLSIPGTTTSDHNVSVNSTWHVCDHGFVSRGLLLQLNPTNHRQHPTREIDLNAVRNKSHLQNHLLVSGSYIACSVSAISLQIPLRLLAEVLQRRHHLRRQPLVGIQQSARRHELPEVGVVYQPPRPKRRDHPPAVRKREPSRDRDAPIVAAVLDNSYLLSRDERGSVAMTTEEAEGGRGGGRGGFC